eukprot:3660034-Amphidinium_carterae.1
MDRERVYYNGPVSYIGNYGGEYFVATLHPPSNEAGQPVTEQIPRLVLDERRTPSPPRGVTVPTFGAPNSELHSQTATFGQMSSAGAASISGAAVHCAPEREPPPTEETATQPGAAVHCAPGRVPMSDPVGSAPAAVNQPPAIGTSSVRSVSPVTAEDELMLSRYFTRGAQGVGEEERANVLRRIEDGTARYEISTEKE